MFICCLNFGFLATSILKLNCSVLYLRLRYSQPVKKFSYVRSVVFSRKCDVAVADVVVDDEDAVVYLMLMMLCKRLRLHEIKEERERKEIKKATNV